MKNIHLNYYFIPSILVSASDAPHWRRLEASALGRRAGASLAEVLEAAVEEDFFCGFKG
jgi:hypothetical protein